MSEENLKTFFASPQKSSKEEIDSQKNYFNSDNIFAKLLDSTPDYLIVLNENRQIVFANLAFRELLGDSIPKDFYGLRLGEALKCQHAFEEDCSGCGTSKFCRTCGAIHSILSSLKGKEDVQECQIVQDDSKEIMELRVWAKPLVIEGKNYSIFTFTDISNEKRRLALERIFFHDVLNTASGLKSSLNLLKDSEGRDKIELQDLAISLTNRLVETIKAQRDIEFAESGELAINLSICNPNDLIYEATNIFRNQEIAIDKKIEIDLDTKEKSFLSDYTLVLRVLGNMLKNALEASQKGDTVIIGWKLTENFIKFFVHNNIYIPLEIQYQIFNRSFSTKGNGRGLGTYSMKLLSEKYLNGKVGFESNYERGTTFFVQYPIE
jgi:nitrogen-specific signal transduction histidine kinase